MIVERFWLGHWCLFGLFSCPINNGLDLGSHLLLFGFAQDAVFPQLRNEPHNRVLMANQSDFVWWAIGAIIVIA
jgi:hypothetical protein